MLSADMPSQFWSLWIGIITLVSVVGLIWLLISVYFISDEDAEHELPTWDEDLREGTRKPPMWWFWMVLALLVISDIYLILYPGLGRFEGALKWSQAGRLTIAEARYDDTFKGMRNLVGTAPLETLRADDALMKSARGIFARNCAACHGQEAQGQADLFPNLRNGHWQWGGTPAQVEQSIRAGRQAVMPGWQDVLGDDGVRDMVDYVRAFANAGGPPAGHPAKEPYEQTCVACHGADGKGNRMLGTPDLTTGVMLYGNSDEALTETIAVGRTGIMPPFGERLDDVEVRMLLAWLTEED